MTNLTEFLLARIAEDEAAAREAGYKLDDHWWLPDYADPHRVLAECEAKKRIVADSAWVLDRNFAGGMYLDYLLNILRLLALPYAEHPDYREEWRP